MILVAFFCRVLSLTMTRMSDNNSSKKKKIKQEAAIKIDFLVCITVHVII